MGKLGYDIDFSGESNNCDVTGKVCCLVSFLVLAAARLVVEKVQITGRGEV